LPGILLASSFTTDFFGPLPDAKINKQLLSNRVNIARVDTSLSSFVPRGSPGNAELQLGIHAIDTFPTMLE